MTIVPLHVASRNLDYFSITRHAHRFGYRAYLVAISSGIHPERAPDGAGNSAQAFYSRKSLTRNVDAKPRQRIPGGNRHTLTIKLEFTFQFFETQHYIVVVAVIRKNVAARPQGAPSYSRLIHRICQSSSL